MEEGLAEGMEQEQGSEAAMEPSESAMPADLEGWDSPAIESAHRQQQYSDDELAALDADNGSGSMGQASLSTLVHIPEQQQQQQYSDDEDADVESSGDAPLGSEVMDKATSLPDIPEGYNLVSFHTLA